MSNSTGVSRKAPEHLVHAPICSWIRIAYLLLYVLFWLFNVHYFVCLLSLFNTESISKRVLRRLQIVDHSCSCSSSISRIIFERHREYQYCLNFQKWRKMLWFLKFTARWYIFQHIFKGQKYYLNIVKIHSFLTAYQILTQKFTPIISYQDCV